MVSHCCFCSICDDDFSYLSPLQLGEEGQGAAAWVCLYAIEPKNPGRGNVSHPTRSLFPCVSKPVYFSPNEVRVTETWPKLRYVLFYQCSSPGKMNHFKKRKLLKILTDLRRTLRRRRKKRERERLTIIEYTSMESFPNGQGLD